MIAAAAGPALLAPGLAMLAAANGWAPRLLSPDARGVSLFAVLTLAIAVEEIVRRPAVGLSPAVVAATAALILAPSGVAAWTALALVAAAAPWPPAPRLLLGGLAAAELFAAAGMNLAKPALLPIEAGLAAGLLELAGYAPEVAGAAIALDGRLTIVAAGCSGAPGALVAGLCASALAHRRGAPRATALAAALAAAAAFYANLVRLAAMATDAELYAFAHGQAGAFLADLAAAAGVIAGVLLAERVAR